MKLYEHPVRLDFNGHVTADQNGAKLEGFSLRLFTMGKTLGGRSQQPEMSVTLTPEQWLDLIDAMKAEFDRVQKGRKELDEMQ